MNPAAATLLAVGVILLGAFTLAQIVVLVGDTVADLFDRWRR